MKEAIIALVLAGAVLGGVGYITSPTGARGGWSDSHSDRMQGRESYYGDSTHRDGTDGPVQVRVRSEDPATAHYLRIEFDYEYRLGHDVEVDDAQTLVMDRREWLRDALLVHLSERTASDLTTGPGKYRLKRHLRDLVQNTLFPGEEARIEDILFRSILVQPARD